MQYTARSKAEALALIIVGGNKTTTAQILLDNLGSLWENTPAYVAVLSQTGVAAPSVGSAPLQNYLSGSADWSYVGEGKYRIVCTNAFPAGKTYLPMPNLPTDNTTAAFKAALEWIDASTIELTVEDPTGRKVNNGSKLHMAIWVYP